VPAATLIEIARRNVHVFGEAGAFERARRKSRSSGSFLLLFADCCRLFAGAGDYAMAAGALARRLVRELSHAEVYVSPEIWARFGLEPESVLRAIDAAFADVEARTGRRLRLLLDAVRQWGPESAHRVLDLHARTRLPRVVGFGLGGDERSAPARDFRGVYRRARRLGLSTTVHAGEWAGPESVREALSELSPDRIDHGIRAAEDRRLLDRLARLGTPLCVAPTSNVATGACVGWRSHPLKKLLAAGVAVCLSADDPTLFSTSTASEYRRARSRIGVSDREIGRMLATARRARFGR
jgi:adenosine deaminase